MDRRKAIKNIAFIMGTSALIGMPGLLLGCDPRKEKGSGSMFNAKEEDLMDEIGETILPATDTPGAKAAGIGGFMALMVEDCYSEADQKIFKQGLQTLKENFKNANEISFVEAKPEQRLDFLKELEVEMETYYQLKTPEEPEHYYRMLKELTLLGYFTSEIGCTEARKYAQVPGHYEGCMPYVKEGKAWATS